LRGSRILAASGLLLVTPAAVAQPKDLVGSWTLVSSVVEQGGNRVEPFGPNPKGALIFDTSGRYAAMIARPALPKLASDNRTAATADEAKAIVAGSIAHFGSYAISEVDKTITFRIETSTHPNWDGAEQKRNYTLSGDELKYTVSTAAVGGGSATLVWRRVK
jgi:Lipocalin-like domain